MPHQLGHMGRQVAVFNLLSILSKLCNFPPASLTAFVRTQSIRESSWRWPGSIDPLNLKIIRSLRQLVPVLEQIARYG